MELIATAAGRRAQRYRQDARDAAALDGYAEDIADLFGPALARAVRRREAVMAAHAAHRLGPDELQRSWIAWESYWSDPLVEVAA